MIISGGVIGTCKLILQTKNEMINKGLILSDDLNIGEGIKDHPNLRINVISKKIGSLNEIDNNIFKKVYMFIKHITGFPTLMNGTVQVLAFT